MSHEPAIPERRNIDSDDATQSTLLAMERAYAQAFRCAEGSPGFAMVDEPGITRVRSDVPTPWFNAVLSSRLDEADQDAVIARLIDEYGARGVPLLWRLGPASTGRASTSARLRAAGFHPAPPSTAIIGPIPALIHVWDVLPVPVRGVRVADRDGYHVWFRIFAEAFGVPTEHEPFFADVAARIGFGPEAETQNLVLYDRGAPVACATTVWTASAADDPSEPRFASIFNFAVVPELRRRGVGKYMLAYAASRLRKQGCRRIGQFSTQAGAPFYLRVTPSTALGAFENWIWLGGGA